eukprot:TRINITY_DN43_c1_g1_i1.p1 TRINITY_DN43_c1_g1~~TRINITY_DN43_c1_g1_i1.p1  ORF type:complete len:1495 (-),score=281.45 TRINITY_DN43_c1_g1_i1:137-4342(-)
MDQFSHLQIVNKELYQPPKRIPTPYGSLDLRLGVSDKKSECKTCGEKIDKCTGHFGLIKLDLPVFHTGYFKHTQQILQMICKNCSRILIEEPERSKLLKKVRNRRLDATARKNLGKKILERAKKVKVCPFCQEPNGTVKKIGTLKLIHDKYKEKGASKNEFLTREFHQQFDEAVEDNKEIKPLLAKAQDDLNPLRTLNLFERIISEDVELFDMDPTQVRPESLLVTSVLVPPVCIRPSVMMSAEQGTNEDDITTKMSDIVFHNSIIKTNMSKGIASKEVMEAWEALQLHCALVVNGDTPCGPQQGPFGNQNAKPIRGICQRLKGKAGRFRGNLSGKRVDFSSRTVISPDPNLRIDQVAVPMLVAKILTFPERVYDRNIEKLQKLVRNGPEVWPGANYVESKSGAKTYLMFGDRNKAAARLQVGDIVERHLEDGDVVLFNRQPSLHKLSIMAHRARVMPWRTLRFNECVCTPYNADFDGDEMNMHLPQTEEARAEALELMGVVHNLITPRNGEPLVAATQDFLTSGFLLTSRDTFYDKGQMTKICTYVIDGEVQVNLPPPTILKPMELWTGKQIFFVLLCANQSEAHVQVSMEVKTRKYTKKNEYMCAEEGYVCFRNSEIISGRLDKTVLGGGSKDNLFHALLRDYGPATAADRMSRLAKLSARWIGDHGFTIGVSDVQPSPALKNRKEKLIEDGYIKCDSLINDYNQGKLQPQPGCTAEQTLEATLTGTLSNLRDEAGKICIQELPNNVNKPIIMFHSGSKGSLINVSQMVACVGQQTLSGSRIPNGFVNRTLPHFEVGAKHPSAKGFVSNSFYSGLTPTEFFFHTMGGREGLVDTAVKTAETGYMQRRLMKALEDLSAQYDGTVRTSQGFIVQFVYGDDGLDPANMEAQDRPVDFPRMMMQTKAIHPSHEEKSLSEEEIIELVLEKLKEPDAKEWTGKFRKEIEYFFIGKDSKRKGRIKGYIDKLREYQNIFEPYCYLNVTEPKFFRSSKNVTTGQELQALAVDKLHRLTRRQVDHFFEVCGRKFVKAKMEAGTAVGALAGQSIGEPGTQMTLKTFHFAGVASMNVTQGVPRIKEIINASKKISTPIITVKLENPHDEENAKRIKANIERTRLENLIEYIKEKHVPSGCYLSIKLNMLAAHALYLDIDVDQIKKAILSTSKLKIKEKSGITAPKDNKLRIHPTDNSREQMLYNLHHLRRALPNVIIKGIPTIERVVRTKDNTLLVEGYGFREVMGTAGVDGIHTNSNHIMEVEQVLGIEAARHVIISEIQYTMISHGMSIDYRHVMLLADIMSFKGEILGITRYGIAKMKDSVLMLASFEKTSDHLFDAAVHSRSDEISGVSECIIMGVPVPLGTNILRVLRRTYKTSLQQKSLLLYPEKKTPEHSFLEPSFLLDNRIHT